MENINTTAHEAEQTKNEIRALLNTYPELGADQGYVAALEQLPAGIIALARKADPIVARAMLNCQRQPEIVDFRRNKMSFFGGRHSSLYSPFQQHHLPT